MSNERKDLSTLNAATQEVTSSAEVLSGDGVYPPAVAAPIAPETTSELPVETSLVVGSGALDLPTTALSAEPGERGGGQWVHCSPSLLNAGVDCGKTPRRPCECDIQGSHDHFIAHTAALSRPAAPAREAVYDEATIKAREGEGVASVPREPTEEQWGGLARDIMLWMDVNSRYAPESLLEHLKSAGREIPPWLADEPEMLDIGHSMSKGTRCVLIYKAMLSASHRVEATGEGMVSVPADEYECLRQIQFYARYGVAQENMVMRFIKELEEIDQRSAASHRGPGGDK